MKRIDEEEYLIEALQLLKKYAHLGFEKDIISAPGVKIEVSTFIVNDDQLMEIKIVDTTDGDVLFLRLQLIPEAVAAAIFHIRNHMG